jgi:hypothetical protein
MNGGFFSRIIFAIPNVGFNYRRLWQISQDLLEGEISSILALDLAVNRARTPERRLLGVSSAECSSKPTPRLGKKLRTPSPWPLC